MTARLIRNPLLALAVLALSGSIGLSQQTPTAPAAPEASPAAPAAHRPPADPRMMHPGMQGNFHGTMHGGMAGRFHGPQTDAMGGGFHIGPSGMWWKNPMVVQRLGLTAEQTQKMDEIFQQSRLQLIDLHADVQKQEVLLEPLLSANPLDTAKAEAQIDKVADARANLEKADARMLLGIRAVLTPDQWTKLRDHRFGEPAAAAQPGPGAPAGAGSHGGRRMRGGPPPATSNLVDPIAQP